MIRKLHQQLINKEITAQDLTRNYLSNIQEKDKDIFAYLTVMEKSAMNQAKIVDKKIENGEEVGLLEGIPGAIKDMICTKGVRTTAASNILDNYIPPYDATAVKRLKNIGAVILGKTNMDEFAMGSSTENSAYGPTKNPRDLERVPGGSSGGSAAAVAADIAVWSLGTDTGGSIRQPSSFCGVVGLKPTYGTVSRYGVIAMASSFDQVGPITRTVEDSAIVLSAIAGTDKLDATSAHNYGKDYTNYLTGEVRDLKIGFVREYQQGLSESALDSFEKVIEAYKKMGATVQEINLPYAKYAMAVYYVIMPCEVSSNLAKFDGIKYGLSISDEKDSQVKFISENKSLLETYLDSRKYGFGAETKRRIMFGTHALSSGYYEAYYLRAQKVRTIIRQEFEKVFREVDLILTPTSPAPAFKLGEKTADPLEMYLADIFTVTANVAGIPAISVPGPEVSIGGKNLPFGFQLMGKWFDEESVLRAAHAYEIQTQG